MTIHCSVHNGDVPDHEGAEVRADEPGSGPVRPVYACWPCIRDKGLQTVDPRTATFIGHRDALPRRAS